MDNSVCDAAGKTEEVFAYAGGIVFFVAFASLAAINTVSYFEVDCASSVDRNFGLCSLWRRSPKGFSRP
jgi:hypothetical protein